MRNLFALLLRGINVGAHNRIKMADLMRLLTEAGFEEVETYIQSGNVRTKTERNVEEAAIATQTVLSSMGIRNATAVALPWARLEELVAQRPFDGIPDGARPHGVFLREARTDSTKLIGEQGGLTITHAYSDVLLGYVKTGQTHTIDFKKSIERPLGTLVTARFWNVIEDWVRRCPQAP